jgi:dihydrofolate synthase/folylpolyglutamate synthase
MSHPDYQATLDFLFGQLPMFQRVGASAYKKDLSNTKALCKFLDHPERKLKCIHVAGTNGKGSVSHMLAAILQAAGYKTGLYTSPHLRDFRERIRINGEMITEIEVVGFTERVKPLLNELQPSFFELTVGMAFAHFAEQAVEVAVIETGLGGRLDSTNVVAPELSVITNIGWDHMDLLGDSLTAIASEKAGIIKADVPVVIGEYQEEVAEVFNKTANEKRALLKFASKHYELKALATGLEGLQFNVYKNGRLKYSHWQSDQAGIYQLKNIATVLMAVELLVGMGWEIDEAALESGLAQVALLTGFAGRWTVLRTKPLVITDTAHNEPGIRLLLEQLATQTYAQLHFVLSMVKDKDLTEILALMPKSAIYYFSKASIPRGLDADLLAAQAATFGLQGNTYPNVKAAYEAALNQASPSDLVLIGGSTFTVAEII